jgi:density-regulated protein
LHSRLYSPDAAAEGLSTLSVEAQKRAEKDAQKKAAKAEAQEARESEKRASSKVYIKRVERNKRKFVTEVSGTFILTHTLSPSHSITWPLTTLY